MKAKELVSICVVCLTVMFGITALVVSHIYINHQNAQKAVEEERVRAQAKWQREEKFWRWESKVERENSRLKKKVELLHAQ